MKQKTTGRSELRAIRVSLVLKLIITVWSLYVAVKSEIFWQGIFYLAVSIVFAGLFIFQLSYYRDKVKTGNE